MSLGERFHIVLVEPAESLNIGAAARAMANLGFCHLHLVAPQKYRESKAHVTARFASNIVDSAIHHPTLAEALASFDNVVGFSGRGGKYRTGQCLLPEWLNQLPHSTATKTALVFGPEESGLRQEHTELCRTLVEIPASSEFPSFNLAQAVLIALHEVRKIEPLKESVSPPLAPWNDFQNLDALVSNVLKRSGFIRVGKPPQIESVVKNLLRRTSPNEWEMGILTGLFGRLDRILSGETPSQDLESSSDN